MTALENPLKTKLAKGEPVFGTMVTMPSVGLTQTLAAAGFDWLVFDMEHGPMTIESVHGMINATAATGCVPLVRLPTVAPWLAKPALDAGALGLLFPMVETPDKAAEAVAAATYPPKGRRGFGPFYAHKRWGVSMLDYARQADAAILKVLFIEHIEAIGRIDEILATDGIDVAFVAPFDLSQSMGKPGDFDAPEFRDAMARAEVAVNASATVLGGLATSADHGRAMLERGYKFLMLGFDGLIIDGAARAMLDGVRS
ncbi:MAG: aldolase/citrate lyase family protein [Rhodospirillaceae bacterium]|jgi:4-hydroxy-2-oxoheptanedioate aldolase